MTTASASDRGRPDLDYCSCGDFRREHEYGIGRCRMPNDALHGMQPCLAFDFVGHVTAEELAYQEAMDAKYGRAS